MFHMSGFRILFFIQILHHESKQLRVIKLMGFECIENGCFFFGSYFSRVKGILDNIKALRSKRITLAIIHTDSDDVKQVVYI